MTSLRHLPMHKCKMHLVPCDVIFKWEGRKEGEQAAQSVVKFVTFARHSTHQVGSCDCDSFCPSPVSFRSSSSSLHSRGNSSVLRRVTDCFPLGRFFDRMIGSLSNCEIAWPQEEEEEGGARNTYLLLLPARSWQNYTLLSLRLLPEVEAFLCSSKN